MASGLDHIVKGAPLSESVTVKQEETFAAASHLTTDHLSTLPTSPPQIYLNLLILEASLRSQYLVLRAKRRQYSFFLLLLTLWTTYFFYALFLQPREDGGVGGSIYWVVEMCEKVALMGGVVTGILVWGTGQWEQGIRWPRRWLGVTNRGLRGFNSKLVIIKGPLWRETLSTIAFLFPFPALFASSTLNSDQIDAYNSSVISQRRRTSTVKRQPPQPRPPINEELLSRDETDLSHGGNHVKLLLLSRAFSPEFRENWELYRSEYWEKENDRRAQLRASIRAHEHEIMKQQAGWFWWTGWRGWKQSEEKHAHAHAHHSGSQRLRSELERERKHSLSTRSGSHSRNSSRSTTPTEAGDEKALGEKVRHGSVSSRKKLRSTTSQTGLRNKVLS